MSIKNKKTKFNYDDIFYYVGYNSCKGRDDIFTETVKIIGIDKEGVVYYNNNIPEKNCFSSYEKLLKVGGYYLETKPCDLTILCKK